MPSLAETLKNAGITEEVISGLPKEVVGAVEGFYSEASTKLQTAEQKETEARETLRLAGLEKQEIDDYVATYGTNLTKTASVEAENKALRTYLEGIKAQGFDVQIPASTAAVPGSPAVGGNAVPNNFDSDKFSARMGDVMTDFIDANNEHIRLYGSPLPISSKELGAEAARSRKTVYQLAEEKFKFADKRQSVEAEKRQKELDSYATNKIEAFKKEQAEKFGSNPNLRAGEPSRNSTVRIKHDEFQKSSGNVPERERRARMLDKIHQDVAAARNA